MSLIEEALNKVEEEKAKTSEALPSVLSSTPLSPLPKRTKHPFRKTILAISLLCIAGSAAWLAFWWGHYHQKKASSSGRLLVQKTRIPRAPSSQQISPLPDTKTHNPSKETPPSRTQAARTPTLDSADIVAPSSPSSTSPPKGKKPISQTSTKPVLAHAEKSASKAILHKVSSTNKTAQQKSAKQPRSRPGRAKKSHPRKKSPTLARKQQRPQSKPPHAGEPLSIQLAKKAIQEGLDAYEKGDLQEAAQALERSTIYAEPTPETLKFLGKIYLTLGEYDKAHTYLRRALSSNPSDPDILEKLGMVFLVKGKNSAAIRSFLKSVKASPYRYSSHVNLGIAYWRTGNLLVAREEFLTAIKLQKDRPEAYFNLAGVYEAMGKYSHAINSLETFLKMSHGKNEAKCKEAQSHLEALRTYIKKVRKK